jgi:uncharacterized protein (TIGR03435 family)
MMPKALVIATLGAVAAYPFFAQTSAGSLTFEVASIKPSAPGANTLVLPPVSLSSGELRVSNVTVKNLVMNAYNVRDFQVSGGPGWIGSERYDIAAKPAHSGGPDNPPDDPRKLSDDQRKTLQEQLRERTRALLADRFHLEVHRESKEQQIYALLVDKNGPRLQETAEGTPDAGRMMIGRGVFNGRGVSLQILADLLSIQLDRPVRDHTGLKARYDIKLEWTPDAGPPLDALPPGPPPAADGPSLFAALPEQLGLRLESQKGPVEIVVIDRVERPSEN